MFLFVCFREICWNNRHDKDEDRLIIFRQQWLLWQWRLWQWWDGLLPALFIHCFPQWFLNFTTPHLPGLVPKQQQQQKKMTSNKDTKRPQQPLISTLGPPQPQIEPQPVQSKPSFVPVPSVSVPSLDSSHLLNSGFDPLVQFMNPHLTQSNTEPNPAIITAAAPVAPSLLGVNEPTGHMPSDTHPFLNQHPIIPSPGKIPVTTTCF